jgi:hypothetical protein
MLRLEVLQVPLVGFILRGLLVIRQLSVVSFLRTIGLSFACFPLFSGQDLPSFTNYLGDLSE